MDFLKLGTPALELVLRSAVIYLVLLIGLRVFGKREIGQFTLFDLVFILLVANAVQPAMTGPDSSLTGGIIIIAVLISLNFAIGFLRVRVPFFNRLVVAPSVAVARDGEWIPGVLEKEGVTREEVMESLREHGVETLKEARLITLESDGSLSVVAREGSTAHHRRHVRFVRHD
ncbi:MAG TPA: YetF domain-containing protein [Candidatus Solibacter sp.]|jgi:uncharacterized membrane protein YcaP (DUF421 family)|nr:YetF domain-containing protein [Candidatus Solibacter sp.]